MATKPAKKAVAKKTATKKYNSGGDVKSGTEKGLRSSSLMSDAMRRRMEEAELEKPIAKKTPAKTEETGQYNGRRFQMSAEAKAAQEKRNKEVFERHNKK